MRIVQVSKHAVDQHTERWPGTQTRDARTQQIVSDVIGALADGRLSVKEPNFTAKGRVMTASERKKKSKRSGAKSLRFVWTPDSRRVYLVDRRDGRVFVVTAIRGDGDTPGTCG